MHTLAALKPKEQVGLVFNLESYKDDYIFGSGPWWASRILPETGIWHVKTLNKCDVACARSHHVQGLRVIRRTLQSNLKLEPMSKKA